jgi:2-phospho-L-lactate guanylyltransferase
MGVWSLVIPVKQLQLAKTRLGGFAGPLRAELALAFAADTAAAALSCPSVGHVFVVTDDLEARAVLGVNGVSVVPDLPDNGLNPALEYGASRAEQAHPGVPVAALSADLPALAPAELEQALILATAESRAFVADQNGDGTVLLTARAVPDFCPRFGPGSAARHREAGFAEISASGLATLRCDVDTPADLRLAMALGLGSHSAAVAARLQWR